MAFDRRLQAAAFITPVGGLAVQSKNLGQAGLGLPLDFPGQFDEGNVEVIRPAGGPGSFCRLRVIRSTRCGCDGLWRRSWQTSHQDLMRPPQILRRQVVEELMEQGHFDRAFGDAPRSDPPAACSGHERSDAEAGSRCCRFRSRAGPDSVRKHRYPEPAFSASCRAGHAPRVRSSQPAQKVRIRHVQLTPAYLAQVIRFLHLAHLPTVAGPFAS